MSNIQRIKSIILQAGAVLKNESQKTQINSANKEEFHLTADSVLLEGYKPILK